MEIIPTALPIELKDKYDIVSNTFIRKDKGEKAEEREVEIGDLLSDDFQPQVKLKQWDNETNFSVRLIDTDPTKPTIETEGNKIKFIKKDRECHFYDIEKGFEFEVILKKKPKTNKVRMSIETKGLKFYRQPPLTEEFQNGHSEQFKKEIVVTETDVKDLEGNVLIHRPIEIINSFAVYHESKTNNILYPIDKSKYTQEELDQMVLDKTHIGKINDKYELSYFKVGKKYKSGKVFHMPFPYLIDANGWKVRAESFNINIENNLLSVVAPQDFINNAVYPVRHAAGLTFGFSFELGTSWNFLNQISGTNATTSDSGTIDKISMFIKRSATGNVNAALYNARGTDTLLTNGVTAERSIADNAAFAWEDFSFGTPPNVAASTEYQIVGWGASGGVGYMLYDSTSAGTYLVYDGLIYGSFPATFERNEYNSYKIAIYCTYTAGATQKEVTDVGSGADAVSVKCQTSVTDSGAGTDIASILASMNLTDTGSGVDTISITQLKSLLETGSGADIISLIAKLNVVDTGAGSEVISLLGQIAQTDTGAGSEALSVLSKLATITDSGSGADALTVLVKIALTDTGAGAEALSILYKNAITDTGVGSEIISILNQFILTDTGTGVDVADKTDLGSEKLVNDSGTGSDALSILTQLAMTDTGTGAEAVNALIKLSVLDNGTGLEIVSLLFQIAQTDIGSGSEALEILRQIAVTETGTASEAITALVQLAVSETASGADVASVSGNIKEIVDTGVGSEALSILVEMSITDSGTGIEILSVLNQIAQTDTGSGADVIDKTALDTKDITDSGSGADVVAFAKQLVLQDSGVGADTIAKQKIVAAVATILSALDKNANIKSTGQNLESNIKLTEQVKAKIKSIINN